MPPIKRSALLKKVQQGVGEVLPPLAPLLDIAGNLSGPSKADVGWSDLADDLRTKRNELVNMQERLKNTPSSHTHKRTIDALEGMEGRVAEKRARSAISRRLDAEDDEEEIAKCYRDMKQNTSHLERDVSLNHWTDSREHITETRLKDLKPAHSAWYDSYAAATIHRRACTPRTRQKILDDLAKWADDQNGPKVYWMNGMAGTGKTTIAYSFSATLDKDGRLAGSFFCSRLLPECSDVTRIASTVAYQFARLSPRFRIKLNQALEREPDIVTRDIRRQFERLVKQPLLAVQHTMSAVPVVVIDALDECSDAHSTERLIDLLLCEVEDMRVKFFISSRPQPVLLDRLRNTQEHIASVVHLQDIEQSLVQADIETYLLEALTRNKVPSEEVEKLAARSGKLFIYAATAVRYIQGSGGPQMSRDRLQNVLSQSFRQGTQPYRDLDALYAMTLNAALDTTRYDTREIRHIWLVLHAVVCAKEPVTATTLTGLLGLASVDEVRAALEPLYSVLHQSNNQDVIATLHASFPDFLLDPGRSERFHCNRSKCDAVLAVGCFEVMASLLQFNICNLDSSFVLDNEVPDLDDRVSHAISPCLFYACRYWSSHLNDADMPEVLIQRTWRFLAAQLLHWLEVMNLKQCIGTAVKSLAQACGWVKAPELRELVEEELRFVNVFAANAVSQSTPHLYVSGQALIKTDGAMVKYYGEQIHNMLGLSGAVEDWNQMKRIATWDRGASISSVACSPDGSRVACMTGNGLVDVLDILTGRLIVRFNVDPRNSGYLPTDGSVAFSPDCSRIAAGWSHQPSSVYDANTGRRLLVVQDDCTVSIMPIMFSPDNSRIVSGSTGHAICVWDVSTGLKLVGQFQKHTDQVTSIALSLDSRRIVSASRDHTVCVWDAYTGHMLMSLLRDRDTTITSVAFLHACYHVVSSALDKTVYVWDAETGLVLFGPFELFSTVYSFHVSHKSNRIVFAAEQYIWVLDPYTGQVLQSYPHEANFAVFTHDDSRIVSDSWEDELCIWDACVAPLAAHSTASSSKGPTFAGPYNTGCVTDVSEHDERHVTPAEPVRIQDDCVTSVAFSYDGDYIVSGFRNGTVCVWDAYAGTLLLGPLEGHQFTVSSVSFSWDSSRILSVHLDDKACVWDRYTGDLIAGFFERPLCEARSVALSHDGGRIVVGTSKMTVYVWDTHSGRVITGPLRGHTGWVISVAFSRDSSRIVSSSFDSTVRVWDARTGQVLIVLLNSDSSIGSVAFSPDDNRIVSCFEDGGIRVWSVHSGKMIKDLPWCESNAYNSVLSVAVSANSSRIVTGTCGGAVILRDADTGHERYKRLEGHSDSVYAVAFSHNSSRVVSGSADGTIRVWDLSTLSRLEHPGCWHVSSDGWIRNLNEGLLAWIPPHRRCLLPSPCNTLLIHKDGFLRPKFDRDRIGENWANAN